jgi:signal transduction histidine kinase/CheY-like chemotaxis protein
VPATRSKRDWSRIKAGFLGLWQNRTIRYVSILIALFGAIGNQLPFEPYDWAQKSISARLNAKPYRGDAVIVEIDSRTLEGLQRPRFTDQDLARVIANLADAKPKRIVIGRIRQRLPSQESSKELLAVLDRISPRPIMFVELVSKKDARFSWRQFNPERAGDHFEMPRVEPATAARVELASEISSSAAFGAPWGLPPTIQIGDRKYPSIAQLLAGQKQPIYQKYEIDLTHDPATIPVINAIDIINGKFNTGLVRGHQILIYSSSDITRDAVVTPFGRAASAAPIAILAAQTLQDGPPLMLGWLPSFLVAVAGIIAWLNFNGLYRRLAFVAGFLIVTLSPILLERFLIFQETSNAVFLMLIVAIGWQWGKFRATLALARSAAETKSWFLAQASHDLRQPIHAIGMLAARLGQTDLSPGQAELTAKIDRSIDAANRMLQSLLDLATIESGSLVPKIGPVTVNTLFAEIEEQSTLAAERNGVDLRFVPSEATILTDRSLTLAMLQNTVSNAIKYASGKRVLVGARRAGSGLALCVYDVGQGISEDDMRHVSKEFFRASSHKKGDVEGTGLGLAIVQRLAKLMELSFTLRSISGAGTAAIISGYRLTSPERHSVRTAEFSAMSPLNGLRVLLLDDDPDSLFATEALLDQWGCLVEAHDRFPETLANCDIVVSDFDFGKGHTLADHRATIKHLAEAGIATIVLSGHHPEAVMLAMQSDFLIVLAKPVRPAELRSVLMASRSTTPAR